MDENQIRVYHGTDFKVYKAIQREGFKCKPNRKHWLGNGIYFYVDENLAEWWATRPTERFGSTIKNAAIITVELNLSEAKVLDLRALKDYRQVAKWYAEFSDIVCCYCEDEGGAIDAEKLRCSFFDYLMKKKGVEVIIGCFNKKQPYKDEPEIEYLEGIDLGYPEVQVCVKEDKQKNIINIIGIRKLGKTTDKENGGNNNG